MDLQGKIIAVLPAKSGVSQKNGNQWMSQEYVLEVPGQYPKKCVFSVFGQDRIGQFNIQMGEDLTIQIDIDAHEYNGRWFNEIRAYNVIRGQQMQQAAPQPQYQQPAPQQFPPQVNQQGQPQYQQQYQPAPAPQPQAQQPVQGTQATTQGLPF